MHQALTHPALLRRGLAAAFALTVVLTLLVTATAPAIAADRPSPQAPLPPRPAPSESRPYDDKLTRLAEILGGIHYLRELCGANDGQVWRDRMRDIIEAEGSTALRRAKLTKAFNQGYQNYSRTYRTCTGSAQTTIARFLTEAEQLADGLSRTN